MCPLALTGNLVHPFFSLPWRPLSGPVLRDTARLSQRYPSIARYGVFGVSTWPIVCDTSLPLFWAFPPWRACEVEVRYPPREKGISAILARYPMKTREMGAIPPSAILSRKGIALYGGVSCTGPVRKTPWAAGAPNYMETCTYTFSQEWKNWAGPV